MENSKNARRLGLYVADATLEAEDPQEHADILGTLWSEYQPRGIEQDIVRQLAAVMQRLRRCDRIETAHYYANGEIPATRHEAGMLMHRTFVESSDFHVSLQRARSSAERAFNRLYQFMQDRKSKHRGKRPRTSEIQIDTDTRHLPAPIPQRRREVEDLQNKPSSEASAVPGQMSGTNPISTGALSRPTPPPKP